MIYYLGFYNSIDSGEKTVNTSFAGIFKMGYIVRKIKDVGKPFQVVSCATREPFGVSHQRTVQKDGYQEIFLKSYRYSGYKRKIGIVLNLISLSKFLKALKKEDTLIVYHAPSLCNLVYKAKKKIGFKLILEIEEIYSADQTSPKREKIEKAEKKVIGVADSYILVNDLIYDKYINNGRPYTVVYGVYDGKGIEEKEKREGINLLFSGSIDEVRGAGLAVEAARFLPSNYTLHITGKGAKAYESIIKSRIEEVNASEENARIVYHGSLSDEALDNLAFFCDIGLNLQNTENSFEAVSYPSKITFYMLHGLTVVSTEMSSVKVSSLAEALEFCDMEAEGVAKAIKNAEIKPKQISYGIITNLDKKVVADFFKLL